MKTQTQFMNAKFSDLKKYFDQIISLTNNHINVKGLMNGVVDEFGNEVVIVKNRYYEYDVYIKTGEGKWDEMPVKTIHMKTKDAGCLFDISSGKTILVDDDKKPHFVGGMSESKMYAVECWEKGEGKLLRISETSKEGAYSHWIKEGEKEFLWVEETSTKRTDGRCHWLHGDEIVSDLKEEKGKDKKSLPTNLKRELKTKTIE